MVEKCLFETYNDFSSPIERFDKNIESKEGMAEFSFDIPLIPISTFRYYLLSDLKMIRITSLLVYDTN